MLYAHIMYIKSNLMYIYRSQYRDTLDYCYIFTKKPAKQFPWSYKYRSVILKYCRSDDKM